MGKQSKKCPKCGKNYTDKIRQPTTAGEYDLFDGELKDPPCLACARADDQRSATREREAAKLARVELKKAIA
jgi:predicted nucleic-acid-binding Zn-ribbon protein